MYISTLFWYQVKVITNYLHFYFLKILAIGSIQVSKQMSTFSTANMTIRKEFVFL